MPPRSNVRVPTPNVRTSGPPSPVIATPGSEAPAADRRTQLQMKNDEINGLVGRIESVQSVHTIAIGLLQQVRATQSTADRNEKIDRLIAMLQAPI